MSNVPLWQTVITTEEENARALAIVEALMEKGERNLTPEEDALLDLGQMR